MELHQLRTFVTVAEEGHLTRAADRLCVSQPAVSAHIKALEGELGIALFVRTPKGMSLSVEGERLVERARRILADTEHMLGEARSLSGALHGQITLGINTDSTFLRLGELSTLMRRDYPGIGLSLAKSNSWDILRDVRRGALDAGFAYGAVQDGGLLVSVLTEVPFCIVGPASWSERLHRADWRGLAEMPWIWMPRTCPFLGILEKKFDEFGARPRICIEADHEDILRALAVSGEGVTLMREDEALHGLEKGELAIWPRERPALSLSWVIRDTRRDEPIVQAVGEAVEQVWRGDEKRRSVSSR